MKERKCEGAQMRGSATARERNCKGAQVRGNANAG